MELVRQDPKGPTRADSEEKRVDRVSDNGDGPGSHRDVSREKTEKEVPSKPDLDNNNKKIQSSSKSKDQPQEASGLSAKDSDEKEKPKRGASAEKITPAAATEPKPKREVDTARKPKIEKTVEGPKLTEIQRSKPVVNSSSVNSGVNAEDMTENSSKKTVDSHSADKMEDDADFDHLEKTAENFVATLGVEVREHCKFTMFDLQAIL